VDEAYFVRDAIEERLRPVTEAMAATDEFHDALASREGTHSTKLGSDPIAIHFAVLAFDELDQLVPGCIQRARKAAGDSWPDLDGLVSEIVACIPKHFKTHPKLEVLDRAIEQDDEDWIAEARLLPDTIIREACAAAIKPITVKNDEFMWTCVMAEFLTRYQALVSPEAVARDGARDRPHIDNAKAWFRKLRKRRNP
jgi:hypothetical protein